MNKALFTIVFTALVAGCAGAIDSITHRPVVENKLGHSIKGRSEIGTLSVTAQRRLVVANLETGNFCSEPPPEAADSITTAIATALKANVSEGKNVSAELASNFARHVNQLYKRSHAVQLFRDATYHLCVNAVNSSNGGNDGYDSYKTEVTSIVTAILPSLDLEVKAYYAVEKARAENPPNVVYQETIICDSTATLDKQNDGSENKLATAINCRPISGNDKGK